jgi:hypothetical protein
MSLPAPARQEPVRVRRASRSAFAALLVAAAAYGFAVFLAVTPAFMAPAPEGQPVGHMTARGLDARGPFQAMAALILLPGLAALAARPLAARLAAPDTASWVTWVAAGSLAAPLWARLATSTSITTLVAGAILPVALLAVRRRAMPFSSLDLLLLPVFLVCFFSLVQLAPTLPFAETVLAAAVLVLLLRLAIGAAVRPGRPPAAWCFSLAPAAQLLHVHLLHDQRSWAAPTALLLVLGSVATVGFLTRGDATGIRRLRWLLVYVSLPIFVLALAGSRGRWNGPLQVHIFEDGHHILPAAEMLRGERLYRDVVPGHGALSDGGISWAAMRVFGPRLDVALLADHHLGTFNSVAVYALGVAGTGSPLVGLMAALFAQAAPPGAAWLRPAASLAAVAFAMAAARRRNPRRFVGAGALVVVALLTSLEMGLYAAVVVLLAVVRSGSWKARGRALTFATSGSLIVAVPVALLLGAKGTLDDMVRVTREVLSLGPVYVLGLKWLAPLLRGDWLLPEIFREVLQPAVSSQLLWTCVVVATAAGLAASPWRGSRRTESLCLLGAWVAVAGFSLAERHHHYFSFGLWPLLAIGAAVLLRSRRPAVRGAGFVAVAALVVLAGPTHNLRVDAAVRRDMIPLEGYVPYPQSPRAGTALFRVEERAMIEQVRAVMERHLRPHETFYDFVNLPILYFLFDRPAPIPQPEVPFYQSPHAQREVIRQLQRDSSVRAALIGLPRRPIDHLPSCRRAPLVWHWLGRNFRPVHDEEGIVVWVRVAQGDAEPAGEATSEQAASPTGAAWRECPEEQE